MIIVAIQSIPSIFIRFFLHPFIHLQICFCNIPLNFQSTNLKFFMQLFLSLKDLRIESFLKFLFYKFLCFVFLRNNTLFNIHSLTTLIYLSLNLEGDETIICKCLEYRQRCIWKNHFNLPFLELILPSFDENSRIRFNLFHKLRLNTSYSHVWC